LALIQKESDLILNVIFLGNLVLYLYFNKLDEFEREIIPFVNHFWDF